MSAEIPIAIIGIGYRFPGIFDNKELYYDFLRNQGGAVIDPAGRRAHAESPGSQHEPTTYHCNNDGFINSVDQFDHFEFGISAEEAAHLEPATGLTLMAAHAALQDSGVDYRGSNTGVFFGDLLTTDGLDDTDEISNHNGVGRCVSIRANCVSITFDLDGPSLAVDTACPASATALHLAMCAIKLGEVDQALVVETNTIIDSAHTVSPSDLSVFQPTNASKLFDASADGCTSVFRAEGAVAILIKPLDRAIQDGDAIYSVITGSAIKTNGNLKGSTIPAGEMQATAIKNAYRIAARDPAEAFYVELHSTGTKIEDLIKANSTSKIFSEGRDAEKILRVGSVKSNIGHAGGCSFLASVVKVSMMLYHKEITPSIRLKEANPPIDFPALKMEVQAELEDMTSEMAAKDGKYVASISSYGVGGSSAHTVMESVGSVSDLVKDASAPMHSEKQRLYLFSIGSLTEPTLGRWQSALLQVYRGVTNDHALRSLARDLGRQTRPYPARSFAVASALNASTKFSNPVLINPNASPKLCLLFSGQRSQHAFMGRQLAEVYPIFMDSIKASDRILVEMYGQESLVKHTGLFIPGMECKLAPRGVWSVPDVVLSLVFVQIAIVDLIQSLGIKYDLVVGQSNGQVALGYASGQYDRETAIGLAVARAAAMKGVEGNGALVLLGTDAHKAETLILQVLSEAKVSEGLWIAGFNSPQAVTVGGKHELIDALTVLAKDPSVGVSAIKLPVNCAHHTPLMATQEEVFKTIARATPLSQGVRKPTVRVMSSMDGKWLDRDPDINYCWDNIHRPVLFTTAIHKIISDEGPNGVVFLEISPHPLLKAHIENCGGRYVGLVRRPNPKDPTQNTGEHYQFLEGIGNLISTGFKNIDFNKLCASPDGVADFVKSKFLPYPYNELYCANTVRSP